MQKERKKFYGEKEKIIIKNNLEQILLYYGATPTKYNWNCVPSRHNNPKANLSVRGNICCCHCGLSGDALKVISIMEAEEDFYKIIKKGLEILNYPNYSDNNNSINNLNANTIIKEKKTDSKFNLNQQNQNYDCDLTKIITENFKKMKRNYYDYFCNRGIDNLDIIKKYRILVGNPTKILPYHLLPYLGHNISSYRYIIPIWYKQKVVNCLLRRDDLLNTIGAKVLNLKGLPLYIFNQGYLEKNKKNHIYFICEGIFDALSFENFNDTEITGIALNSASMVNKFIEIIKNNLDHLKEDNVKFFCCLDNDKAGKEASKKLIDNISEMNLFIRKISVDPHKDINEFYTKNIYDFNLKIYKIIEYFKENEIV
jgi:hypothetical protein